jgi:secreted protein with Ig-like and vWFA domain
MVVLTDGHANPDPVDLAVAQAQAAKQAGITVFTIGLGGDVELDALERMASRSEYSYRAPTADALAAIYRAIAVSIPCPSGGFWGRR